MRLKSAEPHSPQKTFSRPPSGAHARSAPPSYTIRTVPGSARAVAAAAEPVRRWQRVQWQYAAETNGFDTSNRTAPHPHPPVIGSSIDVSLARRCVAARPRRGQSTGQLTTVGIARAATSPGSASSST
jgi:hypothetical protein